MKVPPLLITEFENIFVQRAWFSRRSGETQTPGSFILYV